MMKKLNSSELIDQLEADVRKLILQTNQMMQEDSRKLRTPPAEKKWSAIQALEHLNSYGYYYIPALEKALQEPKYSRDWYKPGFFGDYFTRILSPRDGVIKNKMSAPKDHQPPVDLDAEKVLQTFLGQQQALLELLEQARHKDLGKIKVPISISSLIRLKLGDTFRFLIGHERRHMIQAMNALAAV